MPLRQNPSDHSESVQTSKRHGRENALVTGGGGFLGQAIIQMLIQRGDRVRSFSRNAYPQLDAMGVEQIQGDLANAGDVRRACAGDLDLVYHTAAKAGVWGTYQDYYRTNVLGTRHVLDACQSGKISRLVYTSSPSVIFNGKDMKGVDESVPYPRDYLCAYPETKARAEQMVREASSPELRTITLRPHLIWGPGDNHLVPRILARAQRLKKIGSRENRIDTIYIDNAAEAHILAAEKLKENPSLSGNVYFISQDDPIPLWDMVNHILAAGGKNPVQGSISPGFARMTGHFLEWLYKTLRLPGEPPMTRFVAEELSTAHWFDIRAAKRDFGYHPRVSTREGLARLKQWLDNTEHWENMNGPSGNQSGRRS